MKLLIAQFCTLSFHFHSIKSKYSPQRPVVKYERLGIGSVIIRQVELQFRGNILITYVPVWKGEHKLAEQATNTGLNNRTTISPSTVKYLTDNFSNKLTYFLSCSVVQVTFPGQEILRFYGNRKFITILKNPATKLYFESLETNSNFITYLSEINFNLIL